MDLSGALSNPFVTDKSLLIRLVELRRMLLQRAAERPLEPRPAPPRAAHVLKRVTLVLELAGRPMRACEIHAAGTELLGTPLQWRSVNGILSAYTIGGDRRFSRVRHGVYEMAPTAPQGRSRRRPRV
jgi:hypothetical protein